RQVAGLFQCEGLRRVRQRKSAGGLESLVDVQYFARGGTATRGFKARLHQIKEAAKPPPPPQPNCPVVLETHGKLFLLAVHLEGMSGDTSFSEASNSLQSAQALRPTPRTWR